MPVLAMEVSSIQEDALELPTFAAAQEVEEVVVETVEVLLILLLLLFLVEEAVVVMLAVFLLAYPQVDTLTTAETPKFFTS